VLCAAGKLALLDTVHVAGARFDRMTKKVLGT
jgi:hypothetical protein